MSLLRVRGLKLDIGPFDILEGVDLSVERGEILGLIGESGSGKSMTALSVMGLLPGLARAAGSIRLDGEELLGKSERQLCAIRGKDIGMVFQEPMTALDPLKTIGAQVAETILVHGGVGRREARAEASRVLDRAGLPADLIGRDRFPHELSGGQRQRALIAIAIAMKPKLLIADEPTTALDVTTQAKLLGLFRSLADEEGMGLIFITHDLAVVAGLADKVAVMKEGTIVDSGRTAELFGELRHPYTRRLLAASTHVPKRDPSLPGGPPVLTVEGLARDYRVAPKSLFGKPGRFRAVDNVTFTIERGESIGLVGESGSGKSTLARAIMGLDPVQGGRIAVDGVTHDAADVPLTTRRKLQIVFQDPYGSFDPRQRVDTLIAEPFHLLGASAPRGGERRDRVRVALETVGLSASDAGKYIHEFSGGQRQRLAIARALIIEPKLIVLDEPVSALDVSIRAQILDLLADLSNRLGLSYLFISHDLHVVRAITDRVLVMKAGKIVESGATETVFRSPKHPYTRELVAAAPDLNHLLRGREIDS